jgi:peptidoglycan/xylan/chitin deacetylase (PgdA/CDA1 family)
VRVKSVGYYKRLILLAFGLTILLSAGFSIALLVKNRTLEKMLDTTQVLPDDAVTVGATELEPAGIVREAPVLSYQMLYPDFKAGFFGFNADLVSDKTVFLTFDDGPSEGTAALLEVLKKKGVKASFFVNGKSNRILSDQLERMAEEGHAVGMHSYSHRYNIIYENIENLLDDFYRNYLYIKAETGTAPEILRFPGGSINIFNLENYQSMVAEILRRGFIYYDWNVSAGDAIADATAQSIIDNVVNGVRLCWGPAFVLMHDNDKKALGEALGPIIDILAKDGYVFKALDNSVKPPMFIYPN